MNDWWARILQGTVVTLVVVVALAGGTAILGGRPASTPEPSQPSVTNTQPGTEGELKPSPTPSAKPTTGGEDASQWWILVTLGAAGATIGVRMWRHRRRQVTVADTVEPDAGQVVATALERLDRGQISEAVTGCWRDLEQLAATRGVLRAASEPADVFARRVAATLRLPSFELTELAKLFEQSWYSPASSPRDNAARARSCLVALTQASQAGR